MERTETKMVLGPTFQRGYISPSCPQGERLVCQSCGKVAIIGQEVIHTKDCAWAAQERERRAQEAS